MAVFKFTRAKIDDLTLPTAKKQEYHFDTVVQGLGVCVGAGGTKTYFAENRLNGKKRRVTIGRHGPFVPETAEKELENCWWISAQRH